MALVGPVVAGFGRGSKELGIPTANMDPDTLGTALDGLLPGIYCGWATVGGAGPYKAVLSIGLYAPRGCVPGGWGCQAPSCPESCVSS